MKKKMIILVVLIGGVIASSGALYGAAGPEKVGITPKELEDAKGLAKAKGYSRLYQLLGGQEVVVNPKEEIYKPLIESVFWPVLVSAIEKGNVALTKELLMSLISPKDTKPYGRHVTPAEIATYHNQKEILDLIKRIERGKEDPGAIIFGL